MQNVRRSAEISECGRYRWWLQRSWDNGNGTVCFVMLNPSTADAEIDDPTIRRCMGFAKSWGYSTLSVRNLFPFRSTDPNEMCATLDAHGGERGLLELLASLTADLVVVAWGANVPWLRDQLFLRRAKDVGKLLYCLGKTKHGHPRHPLYCRADLQPILFQE